MKKKTKKVFLRVRIFSWIELMDKRICVCMHAGGDGGRIHLELAKDPEGPRWRARGAAGAPAAWGPCGTHACMALSYFLSQALLVFFLPVFQCSRHHIPMLPVPVHRCTAFS